MTEIHMLIGALLAQIKPYETTPKINKLRCQMRKWLRAYYKKVGEKKYHNTAKHADAVWESAQELLGEDFAIAMSPTLRVLYDAIDDMGGKQIFTRRNFEAAMGSLEAVDSKGYDMKEPELNGYKLSDWFLEKLGVKSGNKFGEVKARLNLRKQERALGW